MADTSVLQCRTSRLKPYVFLPSQRAPRRPSLFFPAFILKYPFFGRKFFIPLDAPPFFPCCFRSPDLDLSSRDPQSPAIATPSSRVRPIQYKFPDLFSLRSFDERIVDHTPLDTFPPFLVMRRPGFERAETPKGVRPSAHTAFSFPLSSHRSSGWGPCARSKAPVHPLFRRSLKPSRPATKS